MTHPHEPVAARAVNLRAGLSAAPLTVVAGVEG